MVALVLHVHLLVAVAVVEDVVLLVQEVVKAHQNHLLALVVVEHALAVVVHHAKVVLKVLDVQLAQEPVRELVAVVVSIVVAQVVLEDVEDHRVQAFAQILVIEGFVTEVVLDLVKQHAKELAFILVL